MELKGIKSSYYFKSILLIKIYILLIYSNIDNILILY